MKTTETLTHLLHLLENGHKTMEPGAAYGFTWVVDLAGMTFRDISLIYRLTGTAKPEDGQKAKAKVS